MQLYISFYFLCKDKLNGILAQHEHKETALVLLYHLVVLVLHIIDAELDEAVLVDGPIGRQTHTSQEQRISCSLPGEKRRHGVCKKRVSENLRAGE